MAETANRVMVPRYRHVPGNHCGSTALRNLLGFHGIEISEEMAFGLGAGACFYYVVLDEHSPSRFTNGRAARLEENFLELTEAPLRLRTESDPQESWEMAKEGIDAGRPVLLLTDLYYLDHYGRSAHFPGHAVVLAGYDDEFAWLSDTAFEDLQTTSLESLREARHSQQPVFPLDGHAIDVPEGTQLSRERLLAHVPRATERAASQMLEPPLGDFEGLPALRRFASEVGDWPEAADDWQWCARFLYQVIERRGTGGGNFRKMYSRFLAEAGYDEADLARGASDEWTALALAARTASEPDAPDPGHWRALSEQAGTVLDAEERLWSALAEKSG
ncbi:MAG TPA: BtrH N-terminal domain-containing protein [Solirubrobacterales bacterium]|nr:BtrH N-terminal domain-containing protein [Solirubrobacterales bacterium]